VKEAVDIPVSVVGSLGDPVVAEDVLRRGEADFVRPARPLLADPDLPREALAGRPERSAPCLRCNECLERQARTRLLRCTVNFRAGREATLERTRARANGSRVVIVGSRPASRPPASRPRRDTTSSSTNATSSAAT
jgi:hypothetical protein